MLSWLQRMVGSDSADAHHEYVHKGLGTAWLPWWMAHTGCHPLRPLCAPHALGAAGARWNEVVRFVRRRHL